MAYIEVKNEYKRYQMGETTITANDGISFEVEKGEVAVILAQRCWKINCFKYSWWNGQL